MSDNHPAAVWPGKAYSGAGTTVYFDGSRCRHFAECVGGLPTVFDTSARPWIQPGEGDPARIAEVVRRCPSGALHYVLADGSGESPQVPTTVEIVPDGPLLLRGDLRIETADGSVRDTRASLCACARSQRSPWCDASCAADHD